MSTPERPSDTPRTDASLAKMKSSGYGGLIELSVGRDLERELAAMEQLAGRLAGALEPFAEFIRKFDSKPLSNLADDFYGIHSGTEWEASLRLSDMRKASEALAEYQQREGGK